ncbi:topoisomerase acting in meiosis, partial [Hysterangium stoloniferum]
ARLFRVIDIIHEALLTDTPTTKRDIYYQDVALFKTQSVVDEVVEFLARILEVPRGNLNVRASPKGLFCGSGLRLHLHEGSVVQGNDSGGTLIPSTDDISLIDISAEVNWVLIIEKEAVFQTLSRANFTMNPRCPGKGLLVTGKGYPDFATRELTSHLSTHLPASVPLFALVDADAYGLDILSVYKNGSQTIRHHDGTWAAPRIQWIGLWGSEMIRFDRAIAPHDWLIGDRNSLGIDRDQLLPLSKHDHKKALEMLKRQEAVMPKQFRKELSHMLHARKKAEIEILTSITFTAASSPFFEPCHITTSEAPFKPIPVEPAIVQYLITKFRLFFNTN